MGNAPVSRGPHASPDRAALPPSPKDPPVNTRFLLRMARWAQNPPREGRVKFVLGIVVLCLGLFAYEQIFGWPEVLMPDRDVHRGYKP